jgi:hypothetical protein
MIFYFFKKNMDDLYDINFQINSIFYKNHIHYNNICNSCTMEDFVKSSMLNVAQYRSISIELVKLLDNLSF